jgi:hypothetical protein
MEPQPRIYIELAVYKRACSFWVKPRVASFFVIGFQPAVACAGPTTCQFEATEMPLAKIVSGAPQSRVVNLTYGSFEDRMQLALYASHQQ